MSESFFIHVSANVDSTYGANVYAFATSESLAHVTSDTIINFAKNNLASLTRMYVQGNPSQSHVSPDRSGTPVTMAANIANMFTDLLSVDTHPIPYAYSEYSVFVVAHNDLSLYTEYHDGQRYNEYNLIENDSIIVSIIQTTKSIIKSHIDNPDGNVYYHYAVAFVDSTTTEDMASWYLDQRILNDSVNPVIYGNVNITSESTEVIAPLTYIVGNLNDLNSFFSMGDVNNSKIFAITRDMGPSSSPLSGIEYHAADIESGNTIAVEMFPNIRKFETEIPGVPLVANVSAYNSVDDLGIPTSIRLLTIERNANITTSDPVTLFELANVYGTEYIIPAEDQKRLHVYSLSTNVTQAMSNTSDFSFSTTVDPALYEYELHMILYTDNGNTQYVRLLTAEQRPTHSSVTKTDNIVNRPTALITGNYDIELRTHTFVANTDMFVFASTEPNLTLANVQTMYNNHVALFSNVDNTSIDLIITYSGAFSQTSLSSNIVTDHHAGGLTTSYDNVNRFYFYNYLRVDDTSNTGYFLEVREQRDSDKTSTDDFFPYTQNLVIHNDHLTATLVSVYNNSSDKTVGNVYAFVVENGATLIDPETLPTGGGTSLTELILSVSPHRVHVFDPVESLLSFDLVYDTSGYLTTIQPDKTYVLNIVATGFTKRETVTYVGTVPGVTGLNAAFVNTSGNIEINSGTAYIAVANSNVHMVAYTYDVLAENTDDIGAFETQIYNSPEGAVVTVPIPLGNPGDNQAINTHYLDFVVDSNLDVENAFTTNGAYVYAWVSDSTGNVSSVSEKVTLTPADRFYPFIQEQSVDAYDGSVLTVTNVSVVESNVIGGVEQRVDKYYVFAFSVDIDSVSDDDLLTRFGAAVEANHGVLGHFNDVEPNIDTYDIHVAESVTFTHVFTSDTDPTSYYTIPISDPIKIVLLAVNSPSNTTKSFRRNFTVPRTVPGVREMTVSFVDANANVAISGGFAYGNATAMDTIKALAYTYYPSGVDMIHPNIASTLLTSSPYDFSSNPLKLSVAIDSMSQLVPVSTVNEIHVFSWVESSALDYATNTHTPYTDKVFSRLTWTQETNTGLVYEGSLFNANVDSNVVSAYVAVFESEVISVISNQDLAEFVVTYKDDSAVVKLNTAYVSFPLQYGEVLQFDSTTLSQAFSSAVSNALHVGVDYNAYLVTVDDYYGSNIVFQAGPIAKTKNYFGVVDPLTLTQSVLGDDVSVTANISSVVTASGNVVAYVSLFTYPESNVDNYEPNQRAIGVTNSTYASVTKSFSTLVDIAQESESAYGAGLVHAYAWVKEIDGTPRSQVSVGVTVDVARSKYIFNPPLDSFVAGDTYVFTYPPTHPLYFSMSPTDNVYFSVSGTPDNTGTLEFTVALDASYNSLYAHCNIHSEMGTDVNGANGIPVEYRTVGTKSEIVSSLITLSSFYVRVRGTGVGYVDESTDTEYYDKLFINPGALSLFNSSDNIADYYAAVFVSDDVPDNVSPFMLGNVTPVSTFVEKYDLFYNSLPIMFDYAYKSDGSQTAIRSEKQHSVYVLASSETGATVLSSIVTVLADTIRKPYVNSFQGLLDLPEGNIDIGSHTLKAGNVGIVDFYMSAFTFDVLDAYNGNIEQFNTRVRSSSYRRLVVSSTTPNQLLDVNTHPNGFANVTASIVDIDDEEVSVISANVAYMYMWVADQSGTMSAVTSSTTQITSISPYPRIRDIATDEGNVTVMSSSVFTPGSNIDKYYLFTVAPSASLTNEFDDTANLTTFVSGINEDVLGLVDFHDFNPDLLEGNVYSIPSASFDKAYSNVLDVTSVEVVTAGTSDYSVYLVVQTDASPTVNLFYHKVTGIMTTGTYVPDIIQPNITYFNLDTSVVNDHQLTATVETLEANLEYYAVVHAIPYYMSAGNIDFNSLTSSLPPVFAAQDATVTDPYYTSFTLGNAVDVQGSVVDLHLINPAYLYVWAYNPVDGAISLITEMQQSIQSTVTFGDPPQPSEPIWVGNVAFHHDNFAPNDYGYSTKESAAEAGLFFADTSAGSYPGGVLILVSSTETETTYTWNVTRTSTYDVLMVAGGGGGGGILAGGGGAGGLVYETNMEISAGTKTIVVGAGGLGGIGYRNPDIDMGLRGNDTSLTGFTTAVGGGGGESHTGGGTSTGGSGGGAANAGEGQNTGIGGVGVSGQGYNGGNTGTRLGAGGGGAGGNGMNGITSPTNKGGDGGAGLDLSETFGTYFGDNGWFASGGGGSVDGGYTPGYASQGGGGDGNDGRVANRSGDAMKHTGGGGGAHGWASNNYSNDRVGGFGGSGIVILKSSEPS